MSVNRINRINDDIQKALSSLLAKINDPRVGGKMLSVVRVETTNDLSYAKVFLSVLGELDEKAFKLGLKSASGWLRRELSSELKLRHTPELIFVLDKSIEHGARIGAILNDLMTGEDDDGSS